MELSAFESGSENYSSEDELDSDIEAMLYSQIHHDNSSYVQLETKSELGIGKPSTPYAKKVETEESLNSDGEEVITIKSKFVEAGQTFLKRLRGISSYSSSDDDDDDSEYDENLNVSDIYLHLRGRNIPNNDKKSQATKLLKKKQKDENKTSSRKKKVINEESTKGKISKIINKVNKGIKTIKEKVKVASSKTKKTVKEKRKEKEGEVRKSKKKIKKDDDDDDDDTYEECEKKKRNTYSVTADDVLNRKSLSVADLRSVCQKAMIDFYSNNFCVFPRNTKQKSNWEVLTRDLVPSSKQGSKGRFFNVCDTCRKIGHDTRNCPVARANVKCTYCGELHDARFCQNLPCKKCWGFGHAVWNCSSSAPKFKRCSRCNQSGHVSLQCSDNWRQFHSTIEPGKPNKVNGGHELKSFSVAYCFSCGRRGHFGHLCGVFRYGEKHCFLPYVSYYDDDDYRDEKNAVSYYEEPEVDHHHAGSYYSEPEDNRFARTNKQRKRHQKQRKEQLHIHIPPAVAVIKKKNEDEIQRAIDGWQNVFNTTCYYSKMQREEKEVKDSERKTNVSATKRKTSKRSELNDYSKKNNKRKSNMWKEERPKKRRRNYDNIF